MVRFDEPVRAVAQRLIEWALREDADERGDLTSEAVVPADLMGEALLVSRAPGVLAGAPVVAMIVDHHNAAEQRLHFDAIVQDGSAVGHSSIIGRLEGRMRSMLLLERTALNFLQRLSGIATLTRAYVDELTGLKCRIFDTRKTTPGWRLLEKYAVACGGGINHRLGLCDGVLIKDNHLAALAQVEKGGSITNAVRRARARYGNSVEIEVEADTLEQFDEALRAEPDAILLDNMTLDNLREAVRRRDAGKAGPPIVLEGSGGVKLSTVRAIAETGVDRISVGALTHSAPALDIGLDYRIS